MTDDTRLARDHPGLTREQSAVALLAETLQLAKEADAAYAELRAAGTPEETRRLEAVHGLHTEIEYAQKLAHATLATKLRDLSEQDIIEAHAAGVIATEDYRQALAAKRREGLEQGRGKESERERG